MKNFFARLAFVFGGLMFLAGCATDLRISGVSITVTDLRPLNATVFETQAALTLRYINESVVPIAVSGSTHKLYLNDSYIGKAVSKDAVGLPSLNTATQTVTLFIENLSLVRKLQELDRNSTISYRIESVLLVEAGEAYDNVKVRSTGTLDLSAFGPKLQP
jgi:LEA14-like dessication related protein